MTGGPKKHFRKGTWMIQSLRTNFLACILLTSLILQLTKDWKDNKVFHWKEKAVIIVHHEDMNHYEICDALTITDEAILSSIDYVTLQDYWCIKHVSSKISW